MALVKLQPSSTLLNTATTLPQVLGKDNESTFTSLYPESKVNSLLKYVEGYPWTVNYYGQIINSGNTLEHIDPSTPSFTQPYYEVLGAIIQVSSPLSSSYDANTGVTSVTGSALVPFKMTPNVGDLFIAQVDSGEDAVFLINSVVRKTHRKDTLYEIDYALYQYTSSNAGLLAQIKEKVQETYYFNKDSNYFNRDALMSPVEHQAILDLSELIRITQSYYFNMFAKQETGTILIPGVSTRMYDPFLITFISKTVSHSVMPAGGIFQFTQFERYSKQAVIWDMLTSRNPGMSRSINKKVVFANSASVRNKGRFGSVYHAGIDYLGVVKDPNVKADVGFFINELPDTWNTDFLTSDNSGIYPLSVKTFNNNTEITKQLLHSLFTDDHYLVSENFYNYMGDGSSFEDLSFIELLIARFIRRVAISKKDLVTVLSSYDQWSVMHQLYLLPVIWLIAKN